MKVTELTKEQLSELKCRYLYEKYDITAVEADDVSDDEIFEFYQGIEFVQEDFFSTAE